MIEANSINIFLDESLVNELWTLAKQEGIPVEKVREISSGVEGRVKFGLGKLWDWLAADVETEVKGKFDGKTSQKLEITSVFRALMLPALLGNVESFGGQNDAGYDVFESLKTGSFVELYTHGLELVQLPTYAAFIRMVIMTAAAEGDAPKGIDLEKVFSMLEKFTSAQRAMNFVKRLEEDSLLKTFFEKQHDELWNALSMSNDDQVLLLSTCNLNGKSLTVYSTVEERFLKRHLAGFTGNRPIRIFGRFAHRKGSILGIQPVAIHLI